MKKKHITKLLLFFFAFIILPAIKIPTGSSSTVSLNKPKYQDNSILCAELLSLPSDIVVDVNLNTDSIKEEFGSFDCYIYSYESTSFVVADVLSQNTTLLELKIITNPETYSFYEFDFLKNYPVVVEKISFSSQLEISFIPFRNSSELSSTIESANQITDKDTYNRILSSLNIEANYKSSFSTPERKRSSSEPKDMTNNQAVLDNYLNKSTNDTDSSQVTMSTATSFETVWASDDSIVNLIPKEYFTTNGQHSKIGLEWGYFINTFTNYGNHKQSSLIIFDFEKTRADQLFDDFVRIKPVIRCNYYYDADTNVVSRGIENTYALANPNYLIKLAYGNDSNFENSAYHPNPTDDDYVWSEDMEYSLQDFSVEFVGESSDKSDIVFESLAAIGGVAVGLLTSWMPLPLSIGIGVATDVLTQVIIDQMDDGENPFIKGMTVSSKGEKILASYEIESEGSNYKHYLEQNGEKISAYAFYPTYSNESGTLIFKSTTDSIEYKTSLWDAEGDSNHQVILSHHFEAEVVNEVIPNVNPTHIGNVSGDWSYLTGTDLRSKNITINQDDNTYYGIMGSVTSQKFFYTPQKSGNYDIVFSDFQSNLHVKISSPTSTLVTRTYNSKTFVDSRGNVFPNAAASTGKEFVYLTAGTLYTIEVWSEFDYSHNKKFNSVAIHVYQANPGLPSITNVDNSNLMRLSKEIQYQGGVANTNYFWPSATGQHTIIARAEYTSQLLDTYISILDSDYREIANNDDDWSNGYAGLRVYLRSDRPYYIVTRMANVTSSATYYLDICKGNYLPDFKGRVLNQTIEIPSFRNKTITYLIKSSESKSIKFTGMLNYTATEKPQIEFSIRNASFFQHCYSYDFLLGSKISYFYANQLYFLELSNPDGKMMGSMDLYCQLN